MTILNEHDSKASSSNSNFNLSEVREETSSKVKQCMTIIESMLRQKSRYLWIKYGDSNSISFHNYMKQRLRKNNIVGLNTSLGLKDKVNDIKWEVQHQFE